MSKLILARRKLTDNVYNAIGNLTRKDILYQLKLLDALSYEELRDISNKHARTNSQNMIAHHIHVLVKYGLIRKSIKSMRGYFLTFRGCKIVDAMKQIDHSEIFMGDIEGKS